ncbi:hypothetical protein JW877_02610 [bacterium]|nr:hypothetical protein [bacterium]
MNRSGGIILVRNILSKITEKYKDEVGCKVSFILESLDQKMAYILLEIFENDYGKLFPSAVKSLKDSLCQGADKKQLILC